MVDDQQLEKKHLNLYEPMMLSTSDRPQPIELVVNEIHDNVVKGLYQRAEVQEGRTCVDERDGEQSPGPASNALRHSFTRDSCAILYCTEVRTARELRGSSAQARRYSSRSNGWRSGRLYPRR